MDNIKRIVVDLTPSADTQMDTVAEPSSRKKRVITTTDRWIHIEKYLGVEQQLSYIKQLHTNTVVDHEICQLLTQQIRTKISAYRAQDKQKGLFNEAELVDLPNAIELLFLAENKCFYCKESVQILYENVRHPKQWSLDRIDNSLGHVKRNLMIACLECNLRRKTMYHERYAFTKQLVLIKKEST